MMCDKETQLPNGLTIKILEEVLYKEFGNVKVKNVKTSSGSAAGDHNLSVITRVKVYFTHDNEVKTKSFIFKDPKKDSKVLEMLAGITKELSWYEQILPDTVKLGVNIGAECYVNRNDWLLLDDLSVQGFKVLDRLAFLDLEHSLEAVKVLAKFHAVTHHLYEINKLPGIAKEDTHFTAENEEMFEIPKRYDRIIQNLKEMGRTEYIDIINDLKQTAWSKMLSCMEEAQDFLSLIQGDYWTTNILFKHDQNGKVLDAKIIDFQMMMLSTPAYDLHFFVCTSIKPEVRNNHLDWIYKAYLEALNDTLHNISSKRSMSHEQFNKMMRGTEFIGIFITLFFLPVVLCESPLQFLPPKHLSEEEKKDYHSFDVVFKQKTYREHLISLLDFYKKNNVI